MCVIGGWTNYGTPRAITKRKGYEAYKIPEETVSAEISAINASI
jgi:hypothetical protein